MMLAQSSLGLRKTRHMYRSVAALLESEVNGQMATARDIMSKPDHVHVHVPIGTTA